MLNYISSKAPWLLIAFCFLGFLVPGISMHVFKILPFVLFFLMFFTLVGLDQKALLKSLVRPKGWLYAVIHTFGMISLCGAVIMMFGLNQDHALAMLGVAATGSLFATPAIVRSIGLDSCSAMTYTITSTLLKPVALYATLWWAYNDHFELDMQAYLIKLIVYIVGPIALSFVIHAFVALSKIKKVHAELAKYNIMLVFLFPLGLMGDFRQLWDSNPEHALHLFMLAFVLCLSFFAAAYLIFKFTDRDGAMIAAITSGNRNVLLTYTIAGAYLGPLFLPLVGALQLPIYLQPLLIKRLLK